MCLVLCLPAKGRRPAGDYIVQSSVIPVAGSCLWAYVAPSRSRRSTRTQRVGSTAGRVLLPAGGDHRRVALKADRRPRSPTPTGTDSGIDRTLRVERRWRRRRPSLELHPPRFGSAGAGDRVSEPTGPAPRRLVRSALFTVCVCAPRRTPHAAPACR